jgi:hypothetical protein
VTWSDFAWDVLSNTIATFFGVIGGIPAGLWIERRIERHRNIVAAVQRGESLGAVASALDTCLDANLFAIEATERDISTGYLTLDAGLELFTWEALKNRIVELIDDPKFVARLARYFARLTTFQTMVSVYRDHHQGPRDPIKDRILKLGPELRNEGRSIREALKRLPGGGAGR